MVSVHRRRGNNRREADEQEVPCARVLLGAATPSFDQRIPYRTSVSFSTIAK